MSNRVVIKHRILVTLILYTAVLWVMTPRILVAWHIVTNVLEEHAGCAFSIQKYEAVLEVKIRVQPVACNCILKPPHIYNFATD
jgi:hypothetical protein